jgi:hypothetical protein
MRKQFQTIPGKNGMGMEESSSVPAFGVVPGAGCKLHASWIAPSSNKAIEAGHENYDPTTIPAGRVWSGIFASTKSVSLPNQINHILATLGSFAFRRTGVITPQEITPRGL